MARILLAKLGTDAHDMGLAVVNDWLSEAGHEVTYAGLYNTPERVLALTREEKPDIIGLSFLGGEPVYLSGRMLDLLQGSGLADIPLVVGGVITPEMRDELAALGVRGVFTPGSRKDAVVEGIADVLAGGRRNMPD